MASSSLPLPWLSLLMSLLPVDGKRPRTTLDEKPTEEVVRSGATVSITVFKTFSTCVPISLVALMDSRRPSVCDSG